MSNIDVALKNITELYSMNYVEQEFLSFLYFKQMHVSSINNNKTKNTNSII